MDEFRTIAKLWPSGDELDLGTDSNVLGGSASFTRNAAPFVTSPDGTHTYQFLFWNTGRHTTNKRRVRWNFSVLGWGTWTATRWYGTPPEIGSGPPRVDAESFSISQDDPVAGPTVINGAASTYAPGAWPYNGNDHQIGTSDAGCSVVAVDPYASQYFTGWQRLMWGGDPTGEFIESDAGLSGAFGGTGYYEHVIGGAFSAAQGASADILATYASDSGGVGLTIPRIWLEWLIGRKPWEPPPVGDESPLDRIRRAILDNMIRATQPVRDAVSEVHFDKVLEAVPKMAAEELKRAHSAMKTTISLGESVVAAIEGRLKGK